MNGKQWILLLVLTDFVALTAWSLIEAGGYVAFFEAVLSSPAGIQVAVDVVIALTLVLIWMVGDARRRGANVWPYVVLTLGLGSIGPLVYLFVREGAKRRAGSELRPADAV